MLIVFFIPLPNVTFKFFLALYDSMVFDCMITAVSSAFTPYTLHFTPIGNAALHSYYTEKWEKVRLFFAFFFIFFHKCSSFNYLFQSPDRFF